MQVRLVTFCLLFAVSIHAQTPASKSADEPTRGTISGKVVNESGQPMAGVSAFVRPANSGGGRTMTTDADGQFQANNLDPGLYVVSASAPAYTSTPYDPNSPVYYRIGETVNLQLVRGGVVTGTVTNGLGEPVIGVRVRVVMLRNAKGQPPGPFYFGIMEQSTDDRGVYRIFGLAAGTYVVSAGGTNVVQPFIFNPYDTDAPTYAPSSTRDDAAEVSVRAGEESNVDIRYRGEPGHTVSGTVRVSGVMTGASVTLAPAGGVVMPVATSFQGPGARGFSFSGVSDGEYDLYAQEFVQSQTPATAVMMVSEPKRITVKGANVGGIELLPKPLTNVSGRLVLEPAKVPECEGKRPPLFAETVVRFRRPEKESNQRSFGGAGSPDANGAFVLRNLSPGRYQFEPRFYARYWYLQSITMGAAPAATAKAQASRINAAANWTVVKSGDQLNNLTITLAEGAASIRGKLASSEPASGVVYLVPSEPDKADDVLRFFVTDIAADGTFALNNLPPGRYWLLMQTNVDAQIANVTKLREPEAATARTKLRRTAETQKNEIQLKPCQNLTDYQLKQ